MTDDITPPKTTFTTRRWDNEHTHKWFMAQTKNSFEPLSGGDKSLYEMVEYAYLACFCGEVIKTKVKTKGEIDND